MVSSVDYKYFEKGVETYGTKAQFENFLGFDKEKGDYTKEDGSFTIFLDRTGIKLGRYDNKEGVGLSYI